MFLTVPHSKDQFEERFLWFRWLAQERFLAVQQLNDQFEERFNIRWYDFWGMLKDAKERFLLSQNPSKGMVLHLSSEKRKGSCVHVHMLRKGSLALMERFPCPEATTKERFLCTVVCCKERFLHLGPWRQERFLAVSNFVRKVSLVI